MLYLMINFERKVAMKTWYVKEFSKLAKMSVRMLHHYDQIGLLKPSLRSSNGYRVYSQDDLLKLERIVALKFFRFSLKQIIEIIGRDEDIVYHLKAQQTCLEQQITQLHRANQTINELVAESTAGKPIDWSKIVSLIEVYHMTEDLKKTWAGQVYSPDQLKQFAELKEKFSEAELEEIKHHWHILIEKVQKNINQDPHSSIAQKLAKEWMKLVTYQYAGNQELMDAVSMAYKYNKIPSAPFDKKLWDFISEAVKYMEEQNKK